MSESPQNTKQSNLLDLGYTPAQVEELEKLPIKSDLIIAGRTFTMNVKTGEIREVQAKSGASNHQTSDGA